MAILSCTTRHLLILTYYPLAGSRPCAAVPALVGRTVLHLPVITGGIERVHALEGVAEF